MLRQMNGMNPVGPFLSWKTIHNERQKKPDSKSGSSCRSSCEERLYIQGKPSIRRSFLSALNCYLSGHYFRLRLVNRTCYGPDRAKATSVVCRCVRCQLVVAACSIAQCCPAVASPQSSAATDCLTCFAVPGVLGQFAETAAGWRPNWSDWWQADLIESDRFSWH